MLTIHFHPNWPHGARTVIESMAADGIYRSQFTTGISNGGLTAFRGGDRWRWENRLFSGRYDEGPATDLPVYGVWNRRADIYGGAVRFGSSYLRLKPEAIERATFCFPDSARNPADLGDRHSLPRLCRLADEAGSDDLNDYVEAQIQDRCCSRATSTPSSWTRRSALHPSRTPPAGSAARSSTTRASALRRAPSTRRTAGRRSSSSPAHSAPN